MNSRNTTNTAHHNAAIRNAPGRDSVDQDVREHDTTRPRGTWQRTAGRRPFSWIITMMAAIVAVVGAGSPAWAGEPVVLAANTLPVIISNITVWVTGLLVGVATLFLTIGGLRYLAAGGDPTEVEKAKSAFKSALIGYALAILAPVLLSVVQGWIGG
jgi:Type IV secretion system pilin